MGLLAFWPKGRCSCLAGSVPQFCIAHTTSVSKWRSQHQALALLVKNKYLSCTASWKFLKFHFSMGYIHIFVDFMGCLYTVNLKQTVILKSTFFFLLQNNHVLWVEWCKILSSIRHNIYNLGSKISSHYQIIPDTENVALYPFQTREPFPEFRSYQRSVKRGTKAV
jgi:hypothetical protein